MSDIAKRNAALAPNPSQVQDFWGDMNQSDFAIPTVRVGNPSSQKYKPGYFNYNNGQALEVMKSCKLLVPKKTRVLYGKGTSGGAARCRSTNHKNPSSEISNPIHPSNCFECVASQWGQNLQGKQRLANELDQQLRDAPLCRETYNLLMADEKDSPFWIAFQGTQLKIVSEKLFSRLRHEFTSLAPYAVAFDMSLEREGNYYNVVFDNFRQSETPERGQELYVSHSQRAAELLSSEHQAQDASYVREASTSESEPSIPWSDETPGGPGEEEYYEENPDDDLPF